MSSIKACTCGLALRMNSTVAAMALAELRKHDSEAADRIAEVANRKTHRDWCGSATAWLKQRKVSHDGLVNKPEPVKES